jgi:hypothetical protein
MSEQILETPYFPTDKTDKSPNSDLLSVLSVPYLSVFKMHGRCNMAKRYEVQDSFGRCPKCEAASLRRRERYDRLRDKLRIEERCLACGHRWHSAEQGPPAWL